MRWDLGELLRPIMVQIVSETLSKAKTMSVGCRSSVFFTSSQLQAKFVFLVRTISVSILCSTVKIMIDVSEYGIAVWAVHLFGGIVTYVCSHHPWTWLIQSSVSPGNPNYTIDELAHLITLTKCTLVVAHPSCQETILAAAHATGLPHSRIVFLREAPSKHFWTVDSLIAFGESSPDRFQERRFLSGEARKALAFLSLSSGTTGMNPSCLLNPGWFSPTGKPKVGLSVG